MYIYVYLIYMDRQIYTHNLNMQTHLQRSAKSNCRKHRVSEGAVLYLLVYPIANEKPARTMKKM